MSDKGELVDYHDRYAAWLLSGLARRYGRSLAEDLAQDTWLQIAKLETLSLIRHPKAFLFRVAANLAASRLRRVRDCPSSNGGVADFSQPADQVEQVTFREVVLGLPEPLRDVFVLSRFGGLTNSEIAEHLGIRPKTVEWRMTRALAHCAAQLRL